jgi:glutamate transport system permease protein
MSSVLYDVPGPRARRRNVVGSIIGGLVLAAVVAWIVGKLADQGIFGADRWEIFEDPEIWEAFGRGAWATIRAAATAAVLAIVLGAVLTALRLSGVWWLAWPARVFTELFRGLPVLLLMYFPLVASTAVTPFMGVVIGLTLYNGAIIAEILRSGVRALPGGQREAGLAIGLTPLATLRNIELPQAVRIMLPTLVSQVVVLLKDTSLGYIVTYPELLRTVQQLQNFYGSAYLFPLFFVAAGLYIAINMTISQTAAQLARRGNRKAAGAKAGQTVQEPDGGA